MDGKKTKGVVNRRGPETVGEGGGVVEAEALENNKWHSKQIWTVFYCSGFTRNG